MSVDEPREGRQLSGAKTSEEEMAGVEEVLVQLVDGAVELEHAAAPLGSVRVMAINRSAKPYGLRMKRRGALLTSNGGAAGGRAAGPVLDFPPIEPGGSDEAVVDLEEGEYVLSCLDPERDGIVGTATLVAQPQQGLPE